MNVRVLSKDGLKLVTLNRRNAIHQRCLNCHGWQSHEVRECDFHDCDLHPFRTGAGKQDAGARAEAIRRYCLWCVAGQRGEVSGCPSTTCSLFPYRKTVVDRSADARYFAQNPHIAHVFESQKRGAGQGHTLPSASNAATVYSRKMRVNEKR